MAATIRDSRYESSSGEKKPILIDRVDGFDCEIFDAFLLPRDDGFITVGDDK
jgi:hypothetical protein